MRVGSGRQFRVHDGSGRVGSPTQRVGSGPEKSDPWSTLVRQGSGWLTRPRLIRERFREEPRMRVPWFVSLFFT